MRFIRKHGHIIPIAGKTAAVGGAAVAGVGTVKAVKGSVRAGMFFDHAVKASATLGKNSSTYKFAKTQAQVAMKSAIRGGKMAKYGAATSLVGLGVVAFSGKKDPKGY